MSKKTRKIGSSIKKVIRDKDTLKDVKTVLTFILAYVIAILTNGLLDEFNVSMLWRITSIVSTLGLYFALLLITDEMSGRAYNDMIDTDEELMSQHKRIKELSKQIISRKAKPALRDYNKKELEDRKEELLEKEENKIQNKKDYVKDKIAVYEMQSFKWYNIRKKRRLRKLKRREKKYQRKIDKLKATGVYVHYEYVGLDDLKKIENDSDRDISEKEKFNDNPKKKIKRRMSVSNFFKLFVFLGLQGAIFASIDDWYSLFIYVLVVTLTLMSTSLMSYELTRRYTDTTHKVFLNDKIELLEWLVNEQNKDKYKEVEGV